MNIIKSKRLPILILIICIIFSCIYSIILVSADSTFKASSKIWDHTYDTLDANDTVYPYDSTDNSYTTDVDTDVGSGTIIKIRKNINRTVESVGLDVTYGISKPLIVYYGELPFDKTHDSDSDVLDGWGGFSFTEKPVNSTPDSKSYWGDISGLSVYNSNGKFKSVSKAETINTGSGGIKSLRLYAKQNCPSGILGDLWFGFKNIGYNFARFLAWVSTQFVRLIIQGKNVDVSDILDAFHLKDTAKLVDEFLIIKENKISLFYAFCLCALVFTIASYVYSYVTAGKKTTDFWRIFISMIIGFAIVAMCTGDSGGRITLGNTIADAADQIMYAIVQDSGASGNGDAFTVKISNEKNKSKCVQAQELSVLYKPYIDIQICTQFGVTKISTLDFDNLGDSGGTNAKKYLKGLSDSSTPLKDFNDNLGYYFWFANSNATKKIAKNTELPSTSAGASEEHLGSMITYLQVQHNAGGHNRTIEDMVKNLAYPSSVMGFILMIGFTIVMILLGLVLFKYGINVVIGKVEIFVALLGLAVAGPLILTGNKKLQDTGKSIIGMLLVSFIEITAWGIVFDIILYTTAILLEASIARIMVTIAFLWLFLKLNPYVEETIKKFLNNTTRSISPELQQSKNILKNKMRQVARDATNWVDNKDRVVGYDEEGNEIRESLKGGALSKLAHFASNSLEDANNRKTWTKLGSEAAEAQQKSRENTNNAKRKVINKNVEDTEKVLDEQADTLSRNVYSQAADDLKAIGIQTGDVSSSGFNITGLDNLDIDKLKSDELKLDAMKIEQLKTEENAILHNSIYAALMKKQEHGEQLTAEEEDILETAQEKLKGLRTSRYELENEFKEKLIKTYTATAAASKLGCKESDIIDGLEDARLSDVVKSHSRQAVLQKDDKLSLRYAEALQAQIDFNDNEANSCFKIGTVTRW